MNLRLFKKEEIINFVEFNITGDNENYNKCHSESRYLHLFLFNIFAECFENSNPLFEVISDNKYNARKIIVLRNQLMKKLREIEEIHSLDVFKHYISQTFLGGELLEKFSKDDSSWSESWKIYHDSLIKVGEDLIDLIDYCIQKDLVLWVIGL